MVDTGPQTFGGRNRGRLSAVAVLDETGFKRNSWILSFILIQRVYAGETTAAPQFKTKTRHQRDAPHIVERMHGSRLGICCHCIGGQLFSVLKRAQNERAYFRVLILVPCAAILRPGRASDLP